MFVAVFSNLYAAMQDENPQWINGYYFPHFPSTDSLYVIPVETDLLNQEFTWIGDFRINDSYAMMMALTLVGMQGIINRYQPRIYLDYTSNTHDWISNLAEHVEIVELSLNHLDALKFLFEEYGAYFEGAVIYDPEVPETINLATMIAGLENRVILAPDQLAIPDLPAFSSVTDLRILVQEQSWEPTEESKYDVYEWAYNNLWEQLEHRIVGIISPGPPTSQQFSPDRFYPLGLAQCDYYVALKLSALWLDPRDVKEAELLGRFLADAPSPVPVTGICTDEVSSLLFISDYGDWEMVISWPNGPLEAANLTVFSGVRPNIKRYQPEMNEDRILATLRKKHVAMMWCSDGDNIGYQMSRGFPRFRWDDIVNEGSLLGWTINPTVANIAPVIWNYYIESRGETALVCGLSGAGYTYPRMMDDSQLNAYISYTANAFDQTGLRTVAVDARGSGEGPWNNALASCYYEGLQGTDYLGAMFGTWGTPWGMHFTYEGVPTPAVRPTCLLIESRDFDNQINSIFSQKADSILIDLGSHYHWHRGQVIVDNLAVGGDALYFENTNSGYTEIILGPYINLVPGNYVLQMQLKVSDNQSSTDFLNVSISYANYSGIAAQLNGFTQIASGRVTPAAFKASDTYQCIEIPFTCDEFISNLEIIVAYISGGADLTADYYHIINLSPTEFPVFAPIFVNVISSDPFYDIPRLFTEAFENRGGLMLTPDEFMSALNPEYMIDFASALLGASDPALIQANQELMDGQYFASLLTTRNALRTYSSVGFDVSPLSHFELNQNYPNPFNPSTTIQYGLPSPSRTMLTVYNILGKKVKILVNDELMEAGHHAVVWDGCDGRGNRVSSSVYFIMMQAGNFVQTRKMVLIE